MKRDTNNFNQCDFVKEINQIKWDNILQTEKRDAKLSLNTFYDAIEEILESHMTKRKLTKK